MVRRVLPLKKEVNGMPQVKIKAKYQVTIPAKIRKELGLEVGDFLEAELEKDRIVLKPQLVMDRAEAWKRFQAALRQIQRQNKDLGEEEVMKDVLEAIQEVRQERHAQSRG